MRSPSTVTPRLRVLLPLLVVGLAALAETAVAAEPDAETPPPVLSADTRLYVAPDSNPAQQAEAWAHRPDDAAAMRVLAAQPVALWLGDWTPDVTVAARERVAAAAARGQTAVLVAYNMVGRDLGLYSAGGAGGAADYRAWIDALAAGLGGGPAVVVVEPDALPHLPQMQEAERAGRFELLNYAVAALAARPHTAVYLDAGNPGWLNATTAAGLLERAGVAAADGFALNVSNYYATDDAVAYGQAVLAELAELCDSEGLGFVVDTSRNGNGPLARAEDPDPAARAAGEQWCNPPGRAVGDTPRALPGPAGVDAFLWIKRPGESDGECRGGPHAGAWWPEYALGLVRNRRGGVTRGPPARFPTE